MPVNDSIIILDSIVSICDDLDVKQATPEQLAEQFKKIYRYLEKEGMLETSKENKKKKIKA